MRLSFFALHALPSAAAPNAGEHLGDAPVREQWDGVSVKRRVHPAASESIETEGMELEASR